MVLPSYSSSSSQAFLLWPFFATRITWRIKPSCPLLHYTSFFFFFFSFYYQQQHSVCVNLGLGNEKQDKTNASNSTKVLRPLTKAGISLQSVSHTHTASAAAAFYFFFVFSTTQSTRCWWWQVWSSSSALRRPAFTLAWPFGIKRRFLHKRPFAIFWLCTSTDISSTTTTTSRILLFLGLCLAIVVVVILQHKTT